MMAAGESQLLNSCGGSNPFLPRPRLRHRAEGPRLSRQPNWRAEGVSLERGLSSCVPSPGRPLPAGSALAAGKHLRAEDGFSPQPLGIP